MAGQHADYLAKQLNNFKLKPGAKTAERNNPIMAGFAQILSAGSLEQAFAGFEATFSLWGKAQFGFTEGSASLVFVFVGATLVGVQGGLIGPLTNRFGSRTLLRAGAWFLQGSVALACLRWLLDVERRRG